MCAVKVALEVGSPTGDLLIGDEDAEQRPRPRGALRREHPHCLQHRRERPLAVAGAAPVEPSVGFLQHEGIGRPSLPHWHHVHVGIEGEHRARAVLEPRDNIDALQLVLLQRDFEALGHQQTAQELRRGGLPARRVLGVDRDKVRQFVLHARDVG